MDVPTEWRETGIDESEVRDAIGVGLAPDDVRSWAPFRPLEIHWARKHGLPLVEARLWAAYGVPIRDTVRARAVGLTLEELRRWQDSGFGAADAWESKETGVTIPQAIAWREAGFVAPDALQLIRDRWTLDEAILARSRDVHRYGC
jgi:hypothetical protein